MSGDVEEWENFVLSLLWVIEQKKCLFSTEALTEIIKQIFSFYGFSLSQKKFGNYCPRYPKRKAAKHWQSG